MNSKNTCWDCKDEKWCIVLSLLGLATYDNFYWLSAQLYTIPNPDVEFVVRFIRNVSYAGAYEKLLCQLAKNLQEFSISKTFYSKIGMISINYVQ